jgi:hypothetical protein
MSGISASWMGWGRWLQSRPYGETWTDPIFGGVSLERLDDHLAACFESITTER